MGILEHPYYGSFGYHVSNFFAPCDLFGTPEELKRLVDAAHGLKLRVIIDLVHSHAIRNLEEGLGCQDGTDYLYFHSGSRGYHPAWDSRCFDYHKDEVLRFLMSNCRYWLEEFHVDGFRFDGVTSMMYLDHGLGHAFTSYDDYFSANVDEDAVTYLGLANLVVHTLRPDAVTIAEDVSGMPGLGAPVADGGLGFDYRLAMGVTDMWFKLLDLPRDEDWSMDGIWYELNNHRQDEECISYVECHDQALVGGKTFIFTLLDSEMYDRMHCGSQSLTVERGIALHKMARLLTFATSANGYLNFMGNEFGHPEWIDFPREGNGWSYAHARRQWTLRDDESLRFKGLGDFDAAMTRLAAAGRLHRQPARLVLVHNDDKLLVFERGGRYFCFNFHPVKSQPELIFDVSRNGWYRPVLTTDDPAFGGFGNVGTDWKTKPRVHDGGKLSISVNLPPRTAVVLAPSNFKEQVPLH